MKKFNIGDKVTINKELCRQRSTAEGHEWDKSVVDFVESSGACTIKANQDIFYILNEDNGDSWWDDDELSLYHEAFPDELFEL